MPIYKRCTRCGKRISSGTQCSCKTKRYIEENKYKADDMYAKFYNTPEWKHIKPIAIAKVNGLDIYSYYIHNRIEYGSTVHHIIPIRDDYSKRLDISNLIYLTEANHQAIHTAMRESKQAYDDMVKLLYSLLKRYARESE